MGTALIQAAREGYAAAGPCPYAIRTRAAAAWALGAWMNQTGRSAPRDIAAIDPRHFAINDMTVRVARADGAFSLSRES